jgi:hypothetical protein
LCPPTAEIDSEEKLTRETKQRRMSEGDVEMLWDQQLLEEFEADRMDDLWQQQQPQQQQPQAQQQAQQAQQQQQAQQAQQQQQQQQQQAQQAQQQQQQAQQAQQAQQQQGQGPLAGGPFTDSMFVLWNPPETRFCLRDSASHCSRLLSHTSHVVAQAFREGRRRTTSTRRSRPPTVRGGSRTVCLLVSLPSRRGQGGGRREGKSNPTAVGIAE